MTGLLASRGVGFPVRTVGRENGLLRGEPDAYSTTLLSCVVLLACVAAACGNSKSQTARPDDGAGRATRRRRRRAAADLTKNVPRPGREGRDRHDDPGRGHHREDEPDRWQVPRVHRRNPCVLQGDQRQGRHLRPQVGRGVGPRRRCRHPERATDDRRASRTTTRSRRSRRRSSSPRPTCSPRRTCRRSSGTSTRRWRARRRRITATSSGPTPRSVSAVRVR